MGALQILNITEFDKKRRKVLLEEDLALVLYPSDIRKYRIEEGEKLEQETLELLLQTLCSRARERTLHLLEFSDKTEAELRARLKREGYPEPAIESALSMALRFRYVDDESYGARYAESRSRHKSKRQILNGMLQKGIDKELAEEILEQQDIDEKGQVQALLEKKGYWGRKLDRKERDKAAGMLARRGYSFDVIYSVMGDMEDDSWAD